MPIAKHFTPADFDPDESCLIDNPLRDLSPSQLRQRADAFATLVSKEHPDGLLARSVKTFAFHIGLSRAPRPPRNLQESISNTSDNPEETDEALKPLFRKAAQVAQNPLKLDRLYLSSHERAALEHDREVKFWNQPKMLRVTVVTVCLSAIVQGWIQSGGNGANQNWPVEFGLLDRDTGQWTYPDAKWVFAGVNAIPFLAACVSGCWLSDPLQAKAMGRRGAIFLAALVLFASLIGSAFTHTWQQLMLCRALVGLGMGAKASVTPILGAETSPSHLRGALVMNWQLFDAFGIFLGFTANLILTHAGKSLTWALQPATACPPGTCPLSVGDSLSWRLQFASASIPDACLLTLIWAIPESPRWLLRQRRHREAFKSLRSLRETDLQAATELFYANAQLQIEAKMQPQRNQDPEKSSDDGMAQHDEHIDVQKQLNDFQDSFETTSYFSRILQLFRNPRTRRATVAASVVMICQQLCGMNVLSFYSSTFFRDLDGTVPTAGEDNGRAVQAVWLSWGVGLANFLFTFPAYRWIDTKGRRFLLFCTYPGMTLSMLAACLSFLDNQAVKIEVVIFMFIFVFFYSWGQGPVAFAYASEVFPLINREAGMSFAVFINLLGAGILTLFVPLAQTTEDNVLAATYNVGQTRLLAIFVGFNVLAMILIFFFVPETAGATIRKREEDDHLSYMRLEELNYIFKVKTRKHVVYQVQQMLPYTFRVTRWWLCSWFTNRYAKPQVPKKMWVWAEMEDDDDGDEQGMSNTTLTSGTEQTKQGEKDVQVSQRSGPQVVSR